MKTIACLGSGSGSLGDVLYDEMVEVGRLLARSGYAVATGGFGGIGMEAPARGARKVEGATVVGYTMRGKKPNQFITELVRCEGARFSEFEDPVEFQYGRRLASLLTSDAFIIAENGGPGTMVELMAIINLNYKVWKPEKRFAILGYPAASGGWASNMVLDLVKYGLFPESVQHLCKVVRTAQAAVDWVTK